MNHYPTLPPIDWRKLFQSVAVALHLLGAFWLTLMFSAYADLIGLAVLPYSIFIPVYAFLSAYGILRMTKGDDLTLFICTSANALIVFSY